MQYQSNYSEIHDWLQRHFGKAYCCEFCQTITAKRYEWCLRKGFNYEKERINFIQLCTSCHRRYDWTDEKSKQISDRMKGEGNVMYGKKFTKEHLENMSKSLKGRKLTAEQKKKWSEVAKRNWEVRKSKNI